VSLSSLIRERDLGKPRGPSTEHKWKERSNPPLTPVTK